MRFATLDELRSMCALGWRVFPCHHAASGQCSCGSPRCGSPGKHPYSPPCRSGVKDATSDFGAIERWHGQLSGECNWAVALGSASSVCVVDIDLKDRDAMSKWSSYAESIGLSTPLRVRTQSGGEHWYFSCGPSGFKTRMRVLGSSIECRGDGSYVILPPSTGPKGSYEWIGAVPGVPLPAIETAFPELLETASVEMLRSVAPAANLSDAATRIMRAKVSEVRSAGPGQRNHALNVAAYTLGSLDHDGMVDVGKWFGALREACSVNGLSDDDGARSVEATIASGLRGGRLRPFTPSDSRKIVVVPIRQSPPPPRKGIPERRPLSSDAPGILASLRDTGVARSTKPLPLFSLNSAISFCATVLGRNFSGPTGLRTNLMIMNVGNTMVGKGKPLEIVGEWLWACGLGHLVGGSGVKSGQAISDMLALCPSQLLVLDEIGDMLTRVTSDRAKSHEQDIITTLMEMSTGAGKVHTGSIYANPGARPRIPVEYPCLNVLGAGVPETIYGTMTTLQINRGQINRWVLTEVPETYVRSQVPDIGHAPPQEVMAWVEAIVRRMPPPTRDNHDLDQGPHMLEVDGIARIMAECDDWVESRIAQWRGRGLENLFGRMMEHSLRYALVAELATDPESWAISTASWQWATEHVRERLDDMARRASERMAESPLEMVIRRIEQELAKAGEAGITKREIMRVKGVCSQPTKMIDEALDRLMTQGTMGVFSVRRDRRTVTAYVAQTPSEEGVEDAEEASE